MKLFVGDKRVVINSAIGGHFEIDPTLLIKHASRACDDNFRILADAAKVT